MINTDKNIKKTRIGNKTKRIQNEERAGTHTIKYNKNLVSEW